MKQQQHSVNRGANPRYPLLVIMFIVSLVSVHLSWSFQPTKLVSVSLRSEHEKRCELYAAPQRLEDNVDGMLYVNDRCINCAACSNFAPIIFERNDGIYKHVVYKQPNIDNKEELESARAALAACPVEAIRVENDIREEEVDGDGDGGQELKDAIAIQHDKPFPRQLYKVKSPDGRIVDMGVYYLGHHNEHSFGAIPYLVMGKSPEEKDISVMVDVPRYSSSAVKAVRSLTATGPDYMFLTHVDDTADHNKWRDEFPTLKRIFHSGDLGRHNWIGDLTLEDVEILLKDGSGDGSEEDLTVWDINGNKQDAAKLQRLESGELVILHTPGHSPGSISLLFRPKIQPEESLSAKDNKIRYPSGILFTGDTYAWTTREGGHMSGFPRYGNNLQLQAATLQQIARISHTWDIIAPGHGHPRFYINKESEGRKLTEMESALEELRSY